MPNTLVTVQVMGQLTVEDLRACLGDAMTPEMEAAAQTMGEGVGRILQLLDVSDPRAKRTYGD